MGYSSSKVRKADVSRLPPSTSYDDDGLSIAVTVDPAACVLIQPIVQRGRVTMTGEQSSRSFRHCSRLLGFVVWITVAMMRTTRAAALLSSRLAQRLGSTPPMAFHTRGLRNSFISRIQSRAFTLEIMKIMMGAVDEDEAIDSTKTLESAWNIPGLKKEVTRLVLRSHKKIAKASTRLDNARALVEKLTGDDNTTLEELEECPDVDALEFELDELRSRLVNLNKLEGLLENQKKKETVLPEEVAALAIDLGVNDEPPAKPQRGPKKKKGPRQEPSRLPYRRFYSVNKTEIRVRISGLSHFELLALNLTSVAVVLLFSSGRQASRG